MSERMIPIPFRELMTWIVTEYGKFNVKGKSTWERAEGLIGLAHPQFREELIASAEKMGIWRRSRSSFAMANRLPLKADGRYFSSNTDT